MISQENLENRNNTSWVDWVCGMGRIMGSETNSKHDMSQAPNQGIQSIVRHSKDTVGSDVRREVEECSVIVMHPRNGAVAASTSCAQQDWDWTK